MMESFERRVRFVTSISFLILDKILVAIVVPLVAQWQWAKTDSPIETIWPAEKGNLSTYVVENATSAAQEHQLIMASPKLMVVFLSYGVLEFLLCPFSGYIGNKFGLDLVAVVGIFIASIICIIYAFVDSLPGILTARMLQGICSAFISPTAFARLIEAYADDDNTAKRVMNFATATTMFSFLGPGIAGITFQYLGTIPCFMTLLTVYIVCLIGIAFTFRLGRHVGNHNKTLNLLNGPKMVGFTLVDVLKDSEIQAAVILLTSVWLPRTFLEPLLSIWISNAFNGGPALAGIVWGTAGLSVIAASVVTSQIAVHKPAYMWLFGIVNMLATSIPLMLLPLSTHPAIAAVLFSLCIYGSFSARNTLLSLYKAIADTKFRSHYALVMGVFHIGLSLPYIIGAPAAIPLFNGIGFQLMCIVVACALCVCAPLFLCFRNLPDASDAEHDRLILDDSVSSSTSEKVIK